MGYVLRKGRTLDLVNSVLVQLTGLVFWLNHALRQITRCMKPYD